MLFQQSVGAHNPPTKGAQRFINSTHNKLVLTVKGQVGGVAHHKEAALNRHAHKGAPAAAVCGAGGGGLEGVRGE